MSILPSPDEAAELALNGQLNQEEWARQTIVRLIEKIRLKGNATFSEDRAFLRQGIHTLARIFDKVDFSRYLGSSPYPEEWASQGGQGWLQACATLQSWGKPEG